MFQPNTEGAQRALISRISGGIVPLGEYRYHLDNGVCTLIGPMGHEGHAHEWFIRTHPEIQVERWGYRVESNETGISVERVVIPEQIKTALENGAHLAISVSGGKDSDAMAITLSKLHRMNGWKGEVILVHADTGRTEWPQTISHIEQLSQELGIPLHVCSRKKGDLLARWWERHETRPDVPPWSSAVNRFCTSDNKTSVIDSLLRHLFPTGTVICALGLRAEESAGRTKKPICSIREKMNTRSRFALTWLPIHQFTESDVWATRGDSLERVQEVRKTVKAGKLAGRDPFEVVKETGWNWHPAYALGNERVSCVNCILASNNDLNIGTEYNPDHYRDLVDLELASGFSFRKGFWLADLRPDLLTQQQREKLAHIRAN